MVLLLCGVDIILRDAEVDRSYSITYYFYESMIQPVTFSVQYSELRRSIHLCTKESKGNIKLDPLRKKSTRIYVVLFHYLSAYYVTIQQETSSERTDIIPKNK